MKIYDSDFLIPMIAGVFTWIIITVLVVVISIMGRNFGWF